jgi:hypothetical protein
MNAMPELDRVERAEAEVERTKAELVDTFQGLAAQLEPKKLAREFWESAKNKGADLAEDAVDAVTKRPVVVTGLVAALAMFLARDPIKDATKKVAGAMKPAAKINKKAVAKPANVEKPVAPPVRRRAPRRAASKTEK